MSTNTPEPQAFELAPRTTPFHWLEGKEGLVWLLSAGLLLLTGVLKSINLVIVLAYVLIALSALNVVLARRPLRHLSARRAALPPIIAGQPTEWTIEVQSSEPVQGYWTLEEHADTAYTAWLVSPTQTDFRVRLAATFPERGRYHLSPLQATSGFPFGLCRRSVELLPGEEFIVLAQPARVDVDMLQAWLLRRYEGREEERRRVRRVVDREADLHGLRDYRPGDPLRRIHWKVTARRGKVTVREYEDSIPPHLVLIVDLWLPRDADAEDHQRIEQAVSLAAGVCREWRREAGARMALVVCAKEPLVLDGPSGPTLTERMLQSLAALDGTTMPEPLPLMQQLSALTLSAPILLVSTRSDSPVALSVRAVVNRPIGSVSVTKPEPWFRLP